MDLLLPMSSSDSRDWHSYNEALVWRGELNLDSSEDEEWRGELKKANTGKEGEPNHYPESYIRFLAFVRLLFHQPYRQTEGFVHSLSRFVEGLQTPDYSTIDRRVNRLQIDLDESLIRSNAPVSIAVDSSGVKVHNGGDWIRHVWKVHKGYLKMHFAVDVKTGQVVSMDVSSEKVGDGRRLKRLVKRAQASGVRVRRVLADGAYDSKANFRFLDSQGIKPLIRVAKNSVPTRQWCYPRRMAVIEQQTFSRRAWGRIHRFGYRWKVEGAYSAIKRVFGEYVRARKFVNMAREMALKAFLYNGFIKASS